MRIVRKEVPLGANLIKRDDRFKPDFSTQSFDRLLIPFHAAFCPMLLPGDTVYMAFISACGKVEGWQKMQITNTLQNVVSGEVRISYRSPRTTYENVPAAADQNRAQPMLYLGRDETEIYNVWVGTPEHSKSYPR